MRSFSKMDSRLRGNDGVAEFPPILEWQYL